MTTEEKWNRAFELSLPIVSVGIGVLSLAITVMSLRRSSALGQRVYYEDGKCLVSVRVPGQWYRLQDFVQPGDPAVRDIYRETGPDAWRCLDWVCRNISYRWDVGEWWGYPSETIERTSGDCEDSSILTCSLLKNFTNAHVVLGSFQGYGHAWCQLNGQILETTYTLAKPVPDPQDYLAFVLFNDQEVIELWPGALAEVFALGRDEVTKLQLMAEVINGLTAYSYRT